MRPTRLLSVTAVCVLMGGLMGGTAAAQPMRVTRLEPTREIGGHLLAVGTYHATGLRGGGLTWGRRLGDAGAVELRGDVVGGDGTIAGLAAVQLRAGGTLGGRDVFRSVGLVWAANSDARPLEPRGVGLALGGGVLPWLTEELGVRVELQAMLFRRQGFAFRASIGLVIGR